MLLPTLGSTPLSRAALAEHRRGEVTFQARVPRREQPVGPHGASGLRGVNLAPGWGWVEVRGGLGTSSKLPGCGEQWGHCGRRGGSRLAGTAACTTGGPHCCLLGLCPPRSAMAAPPSPPPAWPPLSTCSTWRPSGSASVHIQTLTLQEAGHVGRRVGAGRTGQDV